MPDWKYLFQALGIGKAAVPSTDQTGEITFPVESIPDFDPMKWERERMLSFYDVAPGILYSALNIQRSGMRPKYDLHVIPVGQLMEGPTGEAHIAEEPDTNMLMSGAIPMPGAFLV
jgi:hypothetical protein